GDLEQIGGGKEGQQGRKIEQVLGQAAAFDQQERQAGARGVGADRDAGRPGPHHHQIEPLRATARRAAPPPPPIRAGGSPAPLMPAPSKPLSPVAPASAAAPPTARGEPP